VLTKYVTDNHYHIWTDALHARQLARQTSNRWDRGTYVRWVITTGWTALEIGCQDALEEPKISYSFRKNLDAAIMKASLKPLVWDSGIWKQISELLALRKRIAHQFIGEKELFQNTDVAENAIKVIRQAIKAIYIHCDKSVPYWIQDDFDEGWTTGALQLHASGRQCNSWDDDPNAIKITYIYKDQEYLSNIYPPDTDCLQPIEHLFNGIGKPITAIRVYKGAALAQEINFEISCVRGA